MQKYKNQYIDNIKIENRTYDIQAKGLCFHHIAENTAVDETFEHFQERALKTIAEFDFDKKKYPVEKAVKPFWYIWHNYIVKAVNDGYELFKEEWKNFKLNGEDFCGALDLLLVNKAEKKVIICDWKTGSTAKISVDYQNQLTLYAYALANELEIKAEEIPDRIKCYLFFPIAGVKDFEPKSEADYEKFALKNFLNFKFTADDFKERIDRFAEITEESKARDWSKLTEKDANMSFSCSYCQYCGHPKLCKLSYDSGLTFPHSAKVIYPEKK